MATTKSSPRLPFGTCEDLFSKLKLDFEDLKKDWSEQHTFNFIVTAYHLYQDWIDRVGSSEMKRKKNQLPPQAKLLVNVFRDITNATKHWKLDKGSQAKQVVDGVSQPQIADWYAYFKAGPVIYVDVDGARPSMPELSHVAIKLFEWLLDDAVYVFPADLANSLATIFRPLVPSEP